MLRALPAILILMFPLVLCAQHPEILALEHMERRGDRLLDRALERYDLSDYDSANSLFYKALDAGQFAKEDYLYFANSLRSEGKTALSAELLNEYLRLSGMQFGTIPTMAASVSKTDSMLRPSIQPVANSQGIFSILGYNGRIHGSLDGKIHSFQHACAGELSEARVAFADGGIVDHTSVAYFNDGFSAVVTRTNRLHGGATLYLTHRTEDGWSAFKRPLFEDLEGNFCSPYFDEINNILYFASNMAGGQGGYDLYLSYYRKGKFTDPVNLGPKVNTARHELAPYKTDEWLYFSSNGYPSKGGFDLYKYRSVDDFTLLVLPVRNLNSTADEFGVIQLSEHEFIVQRHTERSSELLQFGTPLPLNVFSGTVSGGDGAPIQHAVFVLVQNAGTPTFVEVDPYGQFQFFRESSWKRADLLVMSEGYHSLRSAIFPGSPVQLTLDPIQTFQITKVVDRGSDSSAMTLIPPGGQTTEQIADPDLETEAVTRPEGGVYYVIVGSARNYKNAYKLWNQWVEEFTDLTIIKFGPELYRIGFECGTEEQDAIRYLKDAIRVKPDAWIIRPGTF